jgi:hypothetical protein
MPDDSGIVKLKHFCDEIIYSLNIELFTGFFYLLDKAVVFLFRAFYSREKIYDDVFEQR